MQRKRTIVRAAGAGAALLLAVACGQENPTDVGGSLLPGGVRSYEVILDASRFFVQDTAFSGYFDERSVGYLLLARRFGGALDANILSTVQIPATISARDSAGNTVTDSLHVFTGGRLHLVMDTFAVQAAPPGAAVRLFRLAEPFHAGSATWNLRVDTGGVQLPWVTPGGSAGSIISSAAWEEGADTLTLAIDSATIAAWGDTLSPVRGFVLRTDVPGSRFRVSGISIVLDARSSFRSDTTFTATIQPAERIFLFDPHPPSTAGDATAGGTPAWRTYVRLRERLDTLTLPCADAAPGCSVRLGDASITAATLVYEGGTPFPGYLPEDSVGLVVREVYSNPAVPIERSPLGPFAGFSRLAPPGIFPDGFYEVSIGDYIRKFADDDEATPGPWLALVGSPEGNTFGHAAFRGTPRLRIVISVGSELRLR